MQYYTENRLSYTLSSNETHISSTMTLINLRSKDTGYYSCASDTEAYFFSGEARKYVYVFS